MNAAQLFQMGAQQQAQAPQPAAPVPPRRKRLDLLLRRGEHRQILLGMRCKAPGRRAGLPL